MKLTQKAFWKVDEWAEKLYDELVLIKKTGVEHIPSTITIWGIYSFMVIKVAYGVEKKGSSLFCMGNSISLLSAEADYMRGMLNVERP